MSDTEDVNMTDENKEENAEETSGGNLTSEQKDALKQAFRDIDIDGSGSIDTKELRTVLQLIGQIPTDEEIQGYMEGASEEGQLTEEEFCNFIEEKIPLKSQDEVEQELMDAFAKFDENQDMTIDREEFIKVMTQRGNEPLTEQEAIDLMNSLDTEGEDGAPPDGKLSIKELGRLFMG